MSASAQPRTYVSAVRRDRADRTKDAVLSAFAEQLGSGERSELSVPEAAARAGVAVRTVYHHFPDRESRLRGLAEWIEAKMYASSPLPRRIDDLPALVRTTYSAAQQNEALVRAQLATGVAVEVRARRRRLRVDAIRTVVAQTGAPADAAARAAAVIAHLISAEAGMPLIDRHGLTFEEAAEAVVQAVEAIVADLTARAGTAT